MTRIKQYIGQFHPIVWVLLLGTVLTRGSAFMTLPFLSIYLSRNLELSPIVIGITVGMSPLMGTVGGFIGGHLSDRFGRKPIMLTALFTLTLVYFGFTIANEQIWFILLNAINGLCTSFFEPTSQALMADLTEKTKRMKVYSLRYTAINIGASVGPLLGAYFANTSAKVSFAITGSTYLLYAIVLLWIMNKLVISNEAAAKKVVSAADAFKIIKTDKALRYLLVGIILINMGYSQIDSNLPQYLEKSVEDGVVIFSVLLTINAVMVVFLQMPISHIAEKISLMQGMVFGAIFMTAGLIGFSFINGWVTAIIAMVLLTVGEILIFPANSMMMDKLAPEHLRGTYFGAGQFRKIGHFFGPILGGYLLSHIQGQFMFLIISLVTLASIIFFTAGNKTFIQSITVKAESF
ncbi:MULTISPECIES: MDR family MFS transporter [Neobacillus]|uniref:MFS transporter n=1 Tax=Neobacillus rhizophilus TaxID=2833579 RepID=A0A942U4K3_9BACI|nr:MULTISPECIES: MFS transporter [Neobacillus]MBS4211444.1 MFS transporter [Neobacillus rhizophilus]MBU8916862.1 MFS transporter [Bacillus sp. FJAT-29953]